MLGASEVFLASEDVEKATHAKVGFAGPVGFDAERTLVDGHAAAVADGVTGANETGYHLKGVWYGRDYGGRLASLRLVKASDACPRCGGRLRSYRGIEAGHIFVLGTRYSHAMGATFVDEKQQARELVMGCYGIGVSRLVATTVEQHNDGNGIQVADERRALPGAPRDACPRRRSRRRRPFPLRGARGLRRGSPVGRSSTSGRASKFKDADLIGVPIRITIGSKGLASGAVELEVANGHGPEEDRARAAEGRTEGHRRRGACCDGRRVSAAGFMC